MNLNFVYFAFRNFPTILIGFASCKWLYNVPCLKVSKYGSVVPFENEAKTIFLIRHSKIKYSICAWKFLFVMIVPCHNLENYGRFFDHFYFLYNGFRLLNFLLLFLLHHFYGLLNCLFLLFFFLYFLLYFFGWLFFHVCGCLLQLRWWNWRLFKNWFCYWGLFWFNWSCDIDLLCWARRCKLHSCYLKPVHFDIIKF